ncbi:MAG: hypothetical protein K0R58_4343 [Ramlibacter sp.]|nr:hypothetical protein [Ramlibacter sp.]
MRGELVVGQRFPVGKEGSAQPGREEGELVQQPLRVVGVGGDDGREAALLLLALGQAGQQQRIGRADGTGQGHAPAGRKLG